jgi:hypothetical protein
MTPEPESPFDIASGKVRRALLSGHSYTWEELVRIADDADAVSEMVVTMRRAEEIENITPEATYATWRKVGA